MDDKLADDLHKRLNDCGLKIIKEALAGKEEYLKTSAADGVNDVCIRKLTSDQADRVTEYLKTHQSDAPGRFYIHRYTKTVIDSFGDNCIVEKYRLRYIVDKTKEWSAVSLIKEWWFPLAAGAFFLSHLAINR